MGCAKRNFSLSRCPTYRTLGIDGSLFSKSSPNLNVCMHERRNSTRARADTVMHGSHSFCKKADGLY